jgi:peptidoglycan/LPS O-acetylase OafA/YrhL
MPARVAVIDAARGFAEFWVLGFHAVVYLQLGVTAGVIGPCPTPGGYSYLAPLAANYSNNWLWQLMAPFRIGNLGVAIFFVISGFCIHWPAARAGQDFQFNLGYYVRRRFWRLYPTHFVAVVGSMFLAVAMWHWITSNGMGDCIKVPWSVWWAHFFMVQAQLPVTCQYQWVYNPNLWSLETEFQLYAAYILLRPLANRIGWSRFLLFVLLPVSIGWMAWATSYWGVGMSFPVQTCCIGHLFTWMLGAYVAECLCRGADPRHLIGKSAIGLLVYETMFGSIFTADFMACAMVTAWLLYVLLLREVQSAKTFPGCQRLGWWGMRSYSLYLWHAPILRTVVILVAVQLPWVRDSYYYAFGVAVFGAVTALYVARFAYWAVERHFIGKAGLALIPIRRTTVAAGLPPDHELDGSVIHAKQG